MRWWLAATMLLAIAWIAAPADAYLVEVTTTVSVADTQDEAALRQALKAAVDDVLADAIAFTPTLIVLTRAMVVGDRLYVRLLIADKEGERTVEEMHRGPGADGDRGDGGDASPPSGEDDTIEI